MSGLSMLEASLSSAAHSLRRSAVGVDLAKFDPGRRENDPPFSLLRLANFELSLGVPIQRTLNVLESMQVTRNWTQASEQETEYLAWIRRMHRFAQALAGHAWRGVAPELVVSYVDWDDLRPFAVKDYISGLRRAHPPNLVSAAAALGLGTDELAPTSNLIAQCRATAAYSRARDLAGATTADRRFLERQRARRAVQLASLTPSGQGLTLEAEVERLRGAMVRLIEQRTGFERTLAAYGELVSRVIACLFAWAERTVDVPAITESQEPISVDMESHRLRIHITSNGNYWHLKPGGPFEVALGGPLDGIYVCDALSLHGLGGATLADIHGFRLSDLEAAPT
jgi:hypothetical protein